MPTITNGTIFTLSIVHAPPASGSTMIRPGKSAEVDEKTARIWLGTPLAQQLARGGKIHVGDAPVKVDVEIPAMVDDVGEPSEPEATPEPSEPEATPEAEDLSAIDWSEAVSLVQIETDTAKLEAWHTAEKRKRVLKAIEDRILELIE